MNATNEHYVLSMEKTIYILKSPENFFMVFDRNKKQRY